VTRVTRGLAIGLTAAALAAAACRRAAPTLPYQKIPVERRDIVVTATASGVIQPILTLSVKSKASGEILDEPVQTGDEVRKGQLLARIDPRIPQNNLTQAQANVAVARAQLANATAQLKRSEALLQSQSITPAAYDSAQLASATAQAALATATATLQTARDAMQDTHVQAPITGTVLELDAVLGTVISSPTNDVGGGTVILKMANLDTVQVSALVDETDVGKVQAGLQVTINVDAYANRAFEGRVLKIEPEAQVSQNVTMFPVEVNILNPEHLLKPGMNTEVEIHVGQRQGVLAIPNTALRRARDVASAASVFGLDPRAVARQLAGPAPADGQRSTGSGDTATGGSTLHAAERAPRLPPAGGDPGPGAPRAPGAGADTSYIVFALRGGKIVPVPIRTGLTDQDYMEVMAGLTDRDTVLVLTSAAPR
jgi:HlyD family secretion protein